MTSCASYPPININREQTQHAFETRSLSDPKIIDRIVAVLPADRDNIQWGTAQLLIAANELNPTLAEAKARLAETAAGIKTAKALPNPSLSLSSEYDLKQAGEPSWLYGAATSFLLETGLARRLRLHLAEANVRSARLDYAESIWMVRRDIRASLATLLVAQQRVSLLVQAEADHVKLEQLMRKRLEEGEAAPTEHLQMQIELTRSRTALADARQKLNDARNRLAAAIGIPVTALANEPLTFTDLLHPENVSAADIERLRTQAALSRTDLERAIVDYDSRELELREQLRLQYPAFSAGPGYTWDHGIPKATLGISFTLPLFNHNQGPVGEAVAKRTTAAQHVISVQQQILSEIDAARSGYQDALGSLTLARQQSEYARATVAKTANGLALGSEDQLSLLTAKITAATDELAELDAVERSQLALGQLEDALRTPLSGQETALHLETERKTQ